MLTKINNNKFHYNKNSFNNHNKLFLNNKYNSKHQFTNNLQIQLYLYLLLKI